MPSEAERPLAGMRVLVTRPGAANQTLCDAVRACGGEAIALPAIEIQARDHAQVRAELGTRSAGLTLFVSANAVTHGAWLLLDGTLASKRVAAIGAATASALGERGIVATLQPEDGGYTSEALLAHPALADGGALGEVVIVRGRGGRELLATALAARGAAVRFAEVYARLLPPPATAGAALQRLAQLGAPHIVTATSVEILDNVLRLLGEQAASVKQHSRVLVPSERIAQAAVTAGFRCAPLPAQGPGNDALLAAMRAWWASQIAWRAPGAAPQTPDRSS